MSILDIYNNPPNEGRQIRFAKGNLPEASAEYKPYTRNDQASLRNSKLHFEPQDQPGYSVDGTPKVNLANNRYYAVGERPTDLKTTVNVNDQGHTQAYSDTNKYYTEALPQDLTTLADLNGGTERLQNLER